VISGMVVPGAVDCGAVVSGAVGGGVVVCGVAGGGVGWSCATAACHAAITAIADPPRSRPARIEELIVDPCH
jgi:hypothetical protein